MRKRYIVLIITLILYGCGDIFEYHPYDGRINGEKDINKKNIAKIEEACKGKQTIRFAMISDTHRTYDETKSFVNAINKRNDIDFVIHGGDVTDLGATKEYIWMRDIMNKLDVPYVALIGNHDILANGEEIFEAVFGESDFVFMAGNVKFICLNTNAHMYDYSRNIPDFEFLETELKVQTPAHEKTVFAMHAAPFSDQFNNNVTRLFQRYLHEFPELQFCIHGHDHTTTVEDLFEDGVIYYGCPDASQRTYLEFAITNNDYTYATVEY